MLALLVTLKGFFTKRTVQVAKNVLYRCAKFDLRNKTIQWLYGLQHTV